MIRVVGTAFGVLAVLVLAVAFAAANGGERVTLDLGVIVLYRFPVTFVAFGGLVLGMLVMLVATMQQDLETRRILRRRLAEEDREERSRYRDDTQRDLFDEDPTLPPPPVGRPRRAERPEPPDGTGPPAAPSTHRPVPPSREPRSPEPPD